MTTFFGSYFPSQKEAEKLLIFLHGYNNSQQEMQWVISAILRSCPHLAVYAPVGGFVSSTDPERHSWYKISGFDLQGRRRQSDVNIEEIIQIYDVAAEALQTTSLDLNKEIDHIQKVYGFDDEHTYIAGFSQGAMLALWTALTRRHTVSGCFCFSGFTAAGKALEKKIVSKPPVYLFHGRQDKQVRFVCYEYSTRWLSDHGVRVATYDYDDLQHDISSEEIKTVSDTINNL